MRWANNTIPDPSTVTRSQGLVSSATVPAPVIVTLPPEQSSCLTMSSANLARSSAAVGRPDEVTDGVAADGVAAVGEFGDGGLDGLCFERREFEGLGVAAGEDRGVEGDFSVSTRSTEQAVNPMATETAARLAIRCLPITIRCSQPG